MPRKPKINLEKVKASLNTVCTKCGYAIPLDKVRRIDFDQLECPECGQRFTPGVRSGRRTASHQGQAPKQPSAANRTKDEPPRAIARPV